MTTTVNTHYECLWLILEHQSKAFNGKTVKINKYQIEMFFLIEFLLNSFGVHFSNCLNSLVK